MTELLAPNDFKQLWVNDGSKFNANVVYDARVASKRHKAIKATAAKCQETLRLIEYQIDGARFNRDSDLVKHAVSLRRKIMCRNGKWLPKFVFRDRPEHLFWIEGTSRAVLYNYIPETDENVYLAADAEFILHYDILINRLKFVKDVPTFGRAICTNVVVFDNDLVSTRDPVLAEAHASKIQHFQKHKRAL